MTLVYLGLGTNLGNRKENLKQACECLKEIFYITKKSSVIETEPQYESNQPSFMNQVLEGETDLAPLHLLQRIKLIQEQIGRSPSRRYGPREIDIDILYYNNFIIHEPDLIVPHPRIAERLFVLQPMVEIAPYFECPLTNKTMVQLMKEYQEKKIHGNFS